MKDFPEMEKLFQVKFQQRVKVYLLVCWLELAQTGPALGWQTEESSFCSGEDESPCGGRSAAGEKQEQTNKGCAPGSRDRSHAQGWRLQVGESKAPRPTAVSLFLKRIYPSCPFPHGFLQIEQLPK